MLKRQYWSSRELSRLERVMAVVLMVVFIAVFLERASVLLARVERAAMTTALVNAQNLLRVRAVLLARRGEQGGLAALEGSNPMSAAQAAGSPVSADPPRNYLGALENPDPAVIGGAQWYFDRRENVLVYRVRNGAYFDTRLPGPKRARFAVRIDYVDSNGDGRFDSETDRFNGATLRPVEPYRWLE
jgi:hypothetical protein